MRGASGECAHDPKAMTKDSERRPSPARPQRQGKGKKNAAALSAALRANLQRRKARERALQANDAAPEATSGDEAPETNSEATWIK